MTLPDQIIETATRRGIHFTAAGDRLKWTGPAGAMTPDLLSALRDHKSAILAALTEPEHISRQRWGKAPPEALRLSYLKPSLSGEDAALLSAHFARQPVEVRTWARGQSNRYSAAFAAWPPPIREHAALLDLLLWQWERPLPLPSSALWGDRVRSALAMLRSLTAEMEFFVQHNPTPHPQEARS